MTSTSACVAAPAEVSLQQLDDELELAAGLSDEERSAIWLYAWACRENAARVARLA
jgi:hypothetical protein